MTSPVPSADVAATSLWSKLRFLVSVRWLGLIASVIIFSLAAYFLLAPWQFARNAERTEQNALVAEALTQSPGAITELMQVGTQPDADHVWHTVEATGVFDTDQESYVRLRQDNSGAPAYEVVVPLVLEDGTAVLVDRGYQPFALVEQAEPLPEVPSGTVTVTGRVQIDQTDPMNRPSVVGADGRTQYTAVSSDIIRDHPAFAGYIQLTSDSPGVLAAIALPQADPGPFLSYALQWLGFGTVALVGIGFFIYREFSNPSDGQIYLDEVPDEGDPASHNGSGGAAVPGAAVSGAAPQHAPAPADTSRTPATATSARTRTGKPRFDKSQLYDS